MKKSFVFVLSVENLSSASSKCILFPTTDMTMQCGMPDFKNIAIDLACAITISSEDVNDCIARNGPESIFVAVTTLLSQVSLSVNIIHISKPLNRTCQVLDKCPKKDKLTCAAFNKMLQTSCGFTVVRCRKKSLLE